MPLIYLCLAWLAGITVGPAIEAQAWMLALSLPVFVLAALLPSHRRPLILVGLCMLALSGGLLRYRATIPIVDDTCLQYYNCTGPAVIEGRVESTPEIKGQSLTFRFSANQVTLGGKMTEVRGDALVYLPFYKDLSYGDVLRLSGKLETPPQFDDFDYRGYLAGQHIYSIINYPGVQTLTTGTGFTPLAWIYAARNRLGESLTSCLPGTTGLLAQAILLGMRGGLPDSLVHDFYLTGTTHLIAISGLNLTIVLGIVLTLSVWLLGRRNRLYIWISLAFIWLYTLLTGLPPTMVRAAFMGSVFLLAELLGRQRTGITALFLAAALMLAIDPGVLHDVSFQLSVLSMLGLVLISPWLIRVVSPAEDKGNRHLTRFKKVSATSFGTTLAAILSTWPVTALNFHSFSLASLPATFFAMPAFPGIILTSMLTAITGLIWQPLGIAAGWIAWVFLQYFLLVVDIFAAIPVAAIGSLALQPWQAIADYILLAIIALLIFRRDLAQSAWKALQNLAVNIWQAIIGIRLKSYITPVFVALGIANILVWSAFAVLPDGKLHVSILDVGQGDSILIRTPEGSDILVDAGPDPLAACTQLGRQLPFWDRDIDMLILTQCQSDHIAGAVQIMHKYNIKYLALPAVNFDTQLGQAIIKTAGEKGVETVRLSEGRQIYLGKGLGLAVLNPPREPLCGTDDDINNNSLVLRLSYEDMAFLLTADIATDAERRLLMDRADLSSQVLKVAHHGSRSSTTQEFLAAVSPSAVAISVGECNRFGHPAGEVVERLNAQTGGRTFTTMANGTIEFITDGQRLWYRLEKTSP